MEFKTKFSHLNKTDMQNIKGGSYCTMRECQDSEGCYTEITQHNDDGTLTVTIVNDDWIA